MAQWSSRTPGTQLWVLYSAENTALLERAFASNRRGNCPITVGSNQFNVTFGDMRQVNATGGSRQVRRVTAADAAQRVKCSICCDDGIPAPPPTSSCAHPTSIICEGCLARHISEELNNKGIVTNIRCPVVSCRKLLEHSDVQRAATAKDFARYDGLLTTRFLATLPTFRWCKMASCGSGQLHEGGGEVPIMTCHKCHMKSCYTHDIPWHTGISCEEYDAQMGQENKANADYIQRETKPCPKCNRAIQKNEGCDHMTCRLPGGCGHEFCWKCLADYAPILRRGNHLHQQTCLYYAPYDEDDAEDE